VDLEAALVSQLQPVLGYEPSRMNLEQAIERVSWEGERGEVTVVLRDSTRFAFQLPGRRTGRVLGAIGGSGPLGAFPGSAD
jgi:hypothetical protein